MTKVGLFQFQPIIEKLLKLTLNNNTQQFILLFCIRTKPLRQSNK